MKNVLKWYVVAFLLLSDFLMFAQDPGHDDGTGGDNVEGEDQAPASISPKLMILAILGVSFAFYYFKKMQQDKKLNA